MATKNVVLFRQWFACVYGYRFAEPHANWQLPDNARNIFNRYNGQMGGNDPIKYGSIYEYLSSNKPGATSIAKEVRETGSFNLFTDDGDYTEYLREFSLSRKDDVIAPIKRAIPSAAAADDSVVSPDPAKKFELTITNIGEMRFPHLNVFRSGSALDMIFSDHEPRGGAYGGSVFVCTGESGVGKSTLLADYIMKIKRHEDKSLQERIESRMADRKFLNLPSETVVRWLSYVRFKYGCRPLYISSEMTKTDLWFYYQKMPIIKNLPTLLISDYIQGGLREAILAAFDTDYNLILLDSYADTVNKIRDILGYTTSFAENFLVNLLIEAAEKSGKCIIAIQHMTKGGEYVGSTKLKHTTTGMISIRFDNSGQRYVMFEKNRRGGSMTHKPLYFDLDRETREVRYDVDKFEEAVKLRDEAGSIQDSTRKIANRFDDLFITINKDKKADPGEAGNDGAEEND